MKRRKRSKDTAVTLVVIAVILFFLDYFLGKPYYPRLSYLLIGTTIIILSVFVTLYIHDSIQINKVIRDAKKNKNKEENKDGV